MTGRDSRRIGESGGRRGGRISTAMRDKERVSRGGGEEKGEGRGE